MLEIARRKVARARIEVEQREGLANSDPTFAPASFDRVLTNLVLHHLTTDEKRGALAAMKRWLRPGGELHALDFGPQDNLILKLVSRGVGWLDGATRLRDNWEGKLPELFSTQPGSPESRSLDLTDANLGGISASGAGITNL